MKIRVNVVCIGMVCICLAGSITATADASVWFVKTDAVGGNDGSNWQDAYVDLQDALAVAVPGDQIWVAAGIYTPGGPSTRTATFQLKSGVGIYGGFVGTEVSRPERDPATNLTVLSGDLNGNDVEVLEPQELANESTRSDNSYHVVTGSGTDETAVLDGFVITGGNASDPGNYNGGGMINVASSSKSIQANPTLVNCVFHGNAARRKGGAIYNEAGTPTLIDCVFSENHSNGTSIREGGGGMFDERGSLILRSCRFIGNTTTGNGAGLYNNSATPAIIDTTFEGNVVVRFGHQNNGGAILNNRSDAIIKNCTFIGNSASFGGGIWNWGPPAPTILNCIFSRNEAVLPNDGAGGGIQNWGGNPTVINCTFNENIAEGVGGGIGEGNGSRTIVSNCIFWDNRARNRSDANGQIGGGSSVVTYSCVQSGRSGEGNIDANPHFAKPGYWADINDSNIVVESNDPNAIWIIGDYHLKSEAGRWAFMNSVEQDPNGDNWVFDDITSPCIDRGDPNMSVGDEPIPNGDIINMGAYGGTQQASISIGYPLPLILAHWKLDETEGNVAYDSVGTNDGVIIGLPQWRSEDGAVDGALGLNGTTFIAFNPVLNPADGPFSVLVWVKGGGPGQVVASSGRTNWLMADAATGALMTELSNVGQNGGSFGPEAVITDGNWHRIAFTWDGANARLYVDTLLVAEYAQDGLANSSARLLLGTSADREPGSYWSGVVDDVRIYNGAVSP